MTNQTMNPIWLAVGFACLLTAGVNAPARADVLYNNLTESSASAGAVATYNPAISFSTGSSGFILQDVKLPLELISTPAGAGTITVELLSDSSTSPGSVLDTLGTISDSQLSTSLTPPFDLSLATPMTLAADTRYWLQLVTTNGSAAYWSYDSDDSGIGTAGEYWYNTAYGVQLNSSGPYQAELSGTFVPEPASLALFSIGLAGLGLIRRRA